jgi:galactokinase
MSSTDTGAELSSRGAESSLASVYGESALAAQLARYGDLLEGARGFAGKGEYRFFSAPGRTELCGNHTDHNGGKVLAASVNLDAALCVRDEPGRVLLECEGFAQKVDVRLSELEPIPSERGTTAALVRGVARALLDAGRKVRGVAGRVTSTVISGSGLSSSASFEVAMGLAMLDGPAGGEDDWVTLAKAGQAAENIFFGKPCGLMDQMACASGGALEIDFADRASPVWRRIPFDPSRWGLALYIVDTKGSHAGLTDEYAAVPAEMRAAAGALGRETLSGVDRAEIVAAADRIRAAAGDRALLRALHFAKENDRVDAMADAIARDDPAAFLDAVRASGASSWTLLQNLYASASPTRELCVALALAEDLIGGRGACRVHGGGFAGTVQAYVPFGLEGEFAARMERVFGPGCATRLAIRAAGALELMRGRGR